MYVFFIVPRRVQIITENITKTSNLESDINIDPTLRKIRKNNYTNNMKLSSYQGSPSHTSFDYYGHKLITIKVHSVFSQTTRIAQSGILMWLETSWELQYLFFPLFVEQVHQQQTPLQIILPRIPSFCRFSWFRLAITQWYWVMLATSSSPWEPNDEESVLWYNPIKPLQSLD